MKQEEIRALADSDLAQVRAWTEDEQRTRAEKRRLETIAKIKELAAGEGLSIHIEGARGRPSKARASVNENNGPKMALNDDIHGEKGVKNGR